MEGTHGCQKESEIQGTAEEGAGKVASDEVPWARAFDTR